MTSCNYVTHLCLQVTVPLYCRLTAWTWTIDSTNDGYALPCANAPVPHMSLPVESIAHLHTLNWLFVLTLWLAKQVNKKRVLLYSNLLHTPLPPWSCSIGVECVQCYIENCHHLIHTHCHLACAECGTSYLLCKEIRWLIFSSHKHWLYFSSGYPITNNKQIATQVKTISSNCHASH